MVDHKQAPTVNPKKVSARLCVKPPQRPKKISARRWCLIVGRGVVRVRFGETSKPHSPGPFPRGRKVKELANGVLLWRKGRPPVLGTAGYPPCPWFAWYNASALSCREKPRKGREVDTPALPGSLVLPPGNWLDRGAGPPPGRPEPKSSNPTAHLPALWRHLSLEEQAGV